MWADQRHFYSLTSSNYKGADGISSIQVEKSFLQNEGGYRDGLEPQKGKKQGVVTQ